MGAHAALVPGGVLCFASQAVFTSQYAKWVLGPRLEFVGTGGAHTSDEVFAFMKTLTPGSTFQAVNSYGTTEVPGTAVCTWECAALLALTHPSKPARSCR